MNINNCSITMPPGDDRTKAILTLAETVRVLAEALKTDQRHIYGMYISNVSEAKQNDEYNEDELFE